jgi:hypothetical protein
MSIAAVVASTCCCDTNPCDCATSAFSASWSGAYTIEGDCADCGDPSGTLYGGPVTAETSFTLSQSRVLCNWAYTQTTCETSYSCDDDSEVGDLCVGVVWTLAHSVVGTSRWIVSAQFYRGSTATSPFDQSLGTVSWSTTTGAGDDCPPTATTFNWESGDLTVAGDLCWASGYAPISAWTRGTITLS